MVDKRLGKGGFGQVFLGKRAARRTSTRDTKPQQVWVPFPLLYCVSVLYACVVCL